MGLVGGERVFHISLATIRSKILLGIGVSEIGLRLSKDSGVLIFGIEIVMAYFQWNNSFL